MAAQAPESGPDDEQVGSSPGGQVGSSSGGQAALSERPKFFWVPGTVGAGPVELSGRCRPARSR
jgi:hypothetical protein